MIFFVNYSSIKVETNKQININIPKLETSQMSFNKKLDKIQFTCTMEKYSAIKGNKVLKNHNTDDLADIKLMEGSRIQNAVLFSPSSRPSKSKLMVICLCGHEGLSRKKHKQLTL